MSYILAVIVVFAIIVAGAYVLTGDIEPLFEGPMALHHMLILALLLSSLAAVRPKFSVILKSVLLWGGIGVVALVAYTYRGDLETVTSRVSGELIPGRAAMVGEAVELARRGDGHFQAYARVGDTEAAFLVDSGASMVVLTHETARRAGVDMASLRFQQPVSTANGQTTVARIVLDEMTVGSITKRNVPAAVAQPNDLNANLLGLTYLNRLSGWGVENGRFVMRP